MTASCELRSGTWKSNHYGSLVLYGSGQRNRNIYIFLFFFPIFWAPPGGSHFVKPLLLFPPKLLICVPVHSWLIWHISVGVDGGLSVTERWTVQGVTLCWTLWLADIESKAEESAVSWQPGAWLMMWGLINHHCINNSNSLTPSSCHTGCPSEVGV